MVIGSGPVVVGQAAEFDYAGTQCLLALKELGYESVLINSNPATIMTDKAIADKVYLEPLNLGQHRTKGLDLSKSSEKPWCIAGVGKWKMR